ncbi:MAG: glutaredoxin domain-containing protein, partial [Alistipes sp.]
MRPIKLFYLKNCPFCRKALGYLDELRAANPAYAALEIEMIEESEESDRAESYDYYY